MVSISFGGKTVKKYLPDVVERVRDSSKRQTLRLCKCEIVKHGRAGVHNLKECKYHRLKVGDKLQFRTGSRYKPKKIGEGVCEEILTVKMWKAGEQFEWEVIGGAPWMHTSRDWIESLAKEDGFEDDRDGDMDDMLHPWKTAAEKMFLCLSELYGLDTPKKFIVVRW